MRSDDGVGDKHSATDIRVSRVECCQCEGGPNARIWFRELEETSSLVTWGLHHRNAIAHPRLGPCSKYMFTHQGLGNSLLTTTNEKATIKVEEKRDPDAEAVVVDDTDRVRRLPPCGRVTRRQ